MHKRLKSEQIEEIARHFGTGGQVSPGEFRAVCDMALELLQAAPSQEVIRLAAILVSSRVTPPLMPAQAAALGAAVLKAAQGALIEDACRALQEAHAALVLGGNWIEGLERVRPGSRLGPQLLGLSRSMTKTMHRHLRSTAEALNFGMAGQLEPLDPAEPGYKEIPALDRIARRQSSNELEQAHEALRVGRLGILKIARFTHALSSSPVDRIWNDALAQRAAQIVLDAGAHLAELLPLLSAREGH
jgi:hypothetical protein